MEFERPIVDYVEDWRIYSADNGSEGKFQAGETPLAKM
jgi:hypothetical protein